MKRGILILLSIVFLFGCKSERRKTIDINDILPSSDYDGQKESTVVEQNEGNPALDFFDARMFEITSVNSLSQSFMPDRLGPDSTFKVELYTSDDTVTYVKWMFKDSISTSNAFFNWIDCFGENCSAFSVGESARMQKKPLMIFVNNEELVFIEALNKLQFDKWNEFQDSINGVGNWNWIVEQKRSRKSTWYTYQDGKKIKLEP